MTTPDHFLTFWNFYPRRVGKADAKQQWRWAITQAEPAEIIEAARLYGLAMAGREMKYLPYPGKWLGEERWSDDPAAWGQPKKIEKEPVYQSNEPYADHCAHVRREAIQARAELSRLEPEELTEIRKECVERYGWAIPMTAEDVPALEWSDGAALSTLAYMDLAADGYFR